MPPPAQPGRRASYTVPAIDPIDRIKTAVPAGLEELAQLGRTLEKRRDDILAWFDHPGSSNGPTEAICECLPGWSGTGWSGWFRSR